MDSIFNTYRYWVTLMDYKSYGIRDSHSVFMADFWGGYKFGTQQNQAINRMVRRGM